MEQRRHYIYYNTKIWVLKDFLTNKLAYHVSTLFKRFLLSAIKMSTSEIVKLLYPTQKVKLLKIKQKGIEQYLYHTANNTVQPKNIITYDSVSQHKAIEIVKKLKIHAWRDSASVVIILVIFPDAKFLRLSWVSLKDLRKTEATCRKK